MKEKEKSVVSDCSVFCFFVAKFVFILCSLFYNTVLKPLEIFNKINKVRFMLSL